MITGVSVWGIINATPDSFMESSRYNLSVLEQIIDVVDIGACSTRPGSVPVGPEVEWERLKPVLAEVISRESHPVISVDTYWSEVVRKAYEMVGPIIVNDISCGEADPMMLPTVAALNLKYVAMHHGPGFAGSSKSDSDIPVIEQVVDFFDAFEKKAAEMKIDWILDPGFGFGKNFLQNWRLLLGLKRLKRFGRPVLVGISRKRMTLGTKILTNFAQWVAVRNGADILRVHQWKERKH